MFEDRKEIRPLKDQKAYWEEKLSGGASPSQLFTDFPRPPVPAYLRASEALTLPSALYHQLSSHDDIQQTLLAVLNILLLRYTEQENIMIGTISQDSIRIDESRRESFNNPLALFFDLSGGPDFLELLHRVTKSVQEGRANCDYPFDEVVKIAAGATEMNLNRVFPIMILFDGADFDDVQHHIVPCDLVFMIRTMEQSLSIECQYDSELFEPETIRRMLDHFQNLLGAALNRPQENVAKLPMLSVAEQNQILIEWNSTAANYPRNATVHAVFEEQAAATPTAVAVCMENETLTYTELNRRANRLAHYLRAQGVQQETLVGIFMERSIDMIVSLLAILKAAGAYLPLDPEDPEERLAYLIQDSQVSVVVTQTKLTHRLQTHGILSVCVDQDRETWESHNDSNFSSKGNAKNLCYIVYTSGSTGKPKGVCVHHRGVVRTTKALNYVTLTPSEVFLQVSSLTFDASISEIWGTLLNGGRLVLFPERRPTSAEIESMIHKSGITTIHLIGSLFNHFIENASTNLEPLRQVLTGGDVMSVRHAETALQKLGRGRLINCYGPSECTDVSTCYDVSSTPSTGSIPIGRPVSNTRVYILDSWMQPVPVGVPGEIYIGGDGVSLGYWNRPELTAERFLPDLFDSHPEARLYKTGDRGRWLKDGNIEFLGRYDNQVKVRGFRIELEEVQAALSQHEAVRETVVLVQKRPGEEKQLVAYVVPDRNPGPTPAQLRSYLIAKLPQYMIPSFFVLVDSFPLTTGGKVDRKALASLVIDPVNKSNIPEPPRSEQDQIILKIWSEVLHRKEIGIHHNFFDLGGDSLLAMRIIHRLQSHFQVQLSVRLFFDCATVAGISDLIANQQTNSLKS